MRATYRDENEGLRLQIDSLLERYAEQSRELAEPLRLLYVRRVARMLAGHVAIAGTALLAAVTVFGMIWGNTIWLADKQQKEPLWIGDGGLSYMLMGLVGMVVIAYLGGLLLGRRELRGKLSRAISRTGDAHRDLAHLEAASPALELRRLLAEQERRSIALPLVGALMLAPIALHFVLYLFFYAMPSGVPHPIAGFDSWIGFSVLLVTHAQILTAYMGFRYARQAAATDGIAPLAKQPTGAGSAVGLAFAASLIPGAILFMIPPLLVALTGIAVVVPAFHVARQRLLAERALLAA